MLERTEAADPRGRRHRRRVRRPVRDRGRDAPLRDGAAELPRRRRDRRLLPHRHLVGQGDRGGAARRHGPRRVHAASRRLRERPDRAARGRRRRATSTTRATRRSTARSGRRRRRRARRRSCATRRATSSAGRSRSRTTALIYAGAQKNLGPSGISLVIARRDFIETGRATCRRSRSTARTRPSARCTTRPTRSASTMIGEVVAWIRDAGRARRDGRAQRAQGRAALRLPRSAASVWRGARRAGQPLADEHHVPRRDARSSRRRCSRAPRSAGCRGLRGHRSVGGLRASIYNAFPEEGVHRLVELLDEIERELA